MSNTILGATPRAIPGNDGNPHERFSFAPAFSELFQALGWSPARQKGSLIGNVPNATATMRASSGGSSDATSKASFPLHNTEARQHQGNSDITSDVVLSCCCPSAGADLKEVLRRRRLGTGVLRRVLRRGGGVIEGAQNAARRQKHAL